MEQSKEFETKDPNFQARSNLLLRLQIQKTNETLNKLSNYFKDLQEENEKLSSVTQKVDIPDYPLAEDTFLDSIEKSLQQLKDYKRNSIFDCIGSLFTIVLIVLIGFFLSKIIQKSKSLIPIL